MQQDASADESHNSVTSIAQFQIKRFFEDLKNQPFLAVTLEPDGKTCVYVKANVSDDSLRTMIAALEDIDPDRE